MIEEDGTEDNAVNWGQNPEFLHLDFTPRPEIDSLNRACFRILQRHLNVNASKCRRVSLTGLLHTESNHEFTTHESQSMQVAIFHFFEFSPPPECFQTAVCLFSKSAYCMRKDMSTNKSTRALVCTQEEKCSSFSIVRIRLVMFKEKHARIKIQCMYTHIRTWTYSNEPLQCACMRTYVCVVGVYLSGPLTFEKSSLSDSK